MFKIMMNDNGKPTDIVAIGYFRWKTKPHKIRAGAAGNVHQGSECIVYKDMDINEANKKFRELVEGMAVEAKIEYANIHNNWDMKSGDNHSREFSIVDKTNRNRNRVDKV